MFAGNYDDLRNNRKIETENIMMAATFTRTDIKEEDLPEGDEINMCKAMDQLFQRFENQGIEKGKLNTLKEQLKVKLGTLSNPLEEQLTTTSLEKLNVLTLNILAMVRASTHQAGMPPSGRMPPPQLFQPLRRLISKL